MVNHMTARLPRPARFRSNIAPRFKNFSFKISPSYRILTTQFTPGTRTTIRNMDNGNSVGVRSSGDAQNINKEDKRVDEEFEALIPLETYKTLDSGSRLLFKKMNEQYVRQCDNNVFR
jgi:hypothetical protein